MTGQSVTHQDLDPEAWSGGDGVTMPVEHSIENPVENPGDFAALAPFFRIIREGLAGLVDGDHFFDPLAEDVVVEYVVSVPGYPRRVEGRRAVVDLYRGSASLVPTACASRGGRNLLLRWANTHPYRRHVTR